MKISRTQPAFAHPERSGRVKMSANTAMNSQIARIRKKNATIETRRSPREKSARSSI
jgi:hypothetical protein